MRVSVLVPGSKGQGPELGIGSGQGSGTVAQASPSKPSRPPTFNRLTGAQARAEVGAPARLKRASMHLVPRASQHRPCVARGERQLLRRVCASEGRRPTGRGSARGGERARAGGASGMKEVARTQARECRTMGGRAHLELQSPYLALPRQQAGSP